MALNSSIEWTDATWNPITGCTKVSQGCMNCYAERMAKRLKAMGNTRYKNGFNLTLHKDLIDQPLKWSKPRMIFVNSMSDLFHKNVPLAFIQRVFRTMTEANHHIFQVLTKRSGRLLQLHSHLHWAQNIWIGVSIENESVLYRIDDLREIPASVRFLSCEPLLGPLDSISLSGIQWVIVGGESGPGARPMKREWVDSIREKCRENDVAFFFKQWGGVRKDIIGRELNGRTYDELPPAAYKHSNASEIFRMNLVSA